MPPPSCRLLYEHSLAIHTTLLTDWSHCHLKAHHTNNLEGSLGDLTGAFSARLTTVVKLTTEIATLSKYRAQMPRSATMANSTLSRHQKTHSDDSQRPHKCSICAKGFLYPKDVARHEKTHDGSASPHSQLRCPVPGCTSTSFGRRDNLLRHLRNKHPYLLG